MTIKVRLADAVSHERSGMRSLQAGPGQVFGLAVPETVARWGIHDYLRASSLANCQTCLVFCRLGDLESLAAFFTAFTTFSHESPRE